MSDVVEFYVLHIQVIAAMVPEDKTGAQGQKIDSWMLLLYFLVV